MLKFYCNILMISALSLGTTSAVMAQAVMSDGEAMNRAGQQRMLSQRMAKNWILLSKQTMNEAQTEQLKQSFQRFEQNLQYLSAYSQHQSPVVKAALQQEQQAWAKYRGLLLTAPQAERASLVMASAEQALQSAEYLVKTMTMATPTQINPVKEIIGVSGRQRMLSQRIALFYASQQGQSLSADRKQEYQAAIAGFEEGLKKLESYQGNTPEIRQKLQSVKVRWSFAAHVFSQPKSMTRLIEANCEQLLAEMDAITQHYAALAPNQTRA